MEKNIAVIWGDCSSPEIVKQTLRVLDKVAEKYGHTFHYTDAAMGGEAIDKYGDPLPQHELDKCLAADSVLLGAVGGPKWEGLPGEQRPEKGLLRLRAGMGLYSNNRPARIWPQLAPASPLKPEIVAKGIDFIISRSLSSLLRDAAVVARIDCLQSFARLACERRYVRPVLDDGKLIDIRQGRHPVIETLLPVGEEYVPNDVMLDDKEQQIMMITGPNMSGKSALLRQTALIILMAQMGSFVPAKSAHIGVVDKIFTRVGASDNISQGESTFMVEMLESASILNNISDRSIVLLDEIGRGTSTYDGISIAWAMVEYLHNHPSAHAKTLFATHYHELNEMEQMCPRVKNFHVSVKEMGNQIVFLRKLERGGTEHSFGIHVARMAGMPVSVVSRADEILRNLELVYGNNEIVPSRSIKNRGKKPSPSVKEAAENGAPQNMQLSMFQLDDPVLVQIRDQIKGLDINSLTPIEALNKLNEIKKITGI